MLIYLIPFYILILSVKCFFKCKLKSLSIHQCMSNFSNSLEWDLHWPMHLLVVLGNWFNVGIPSIFSTNFLKSSSGHWNWIVIWSSAMDTSCSFIETLWICCTTVINWSSPWWSNCIFPFSWWSSQERYSISLHLSGYILRINFVFVRNITIKNERSCIKWCLEGALSWLHSWAVFWSVLNTHCLYSFSSNGLFWGILSKEFWVGHCGVIECYMIVHWAIKVLSVTSMSMIIILRALNVKIRDPSKFTIDISILWYTRIVWHPCSFNFIHLIWIMFSSWF